MLVYEQPAVRSRRVGIVTVLPEASVRVKDGPSTVTAGPEWSVTVVAFALDGDGERRPR